MSPAGLPDDEKRLVELATGFALGELETHELQELYERIRSGDTDGNRAARIVWETLGTAVDLRAVLDQQFEHTVRHRLEDTAETGEDDAGIAPAGRSRGFLRKLASRIGIVKPTLQPVPPVPPVPTAAARSRGRRRTVGLALLGACLAIALLVVWLVRDTSVKVTAVTGSVTLEGRAVTPGTSLPRSPVIAAEGSRLWLRWPDGHTAVIAGPANLVPHRSGLSLSSGTAWFETRGPFTLGLPDGGAQTAAPGEFAAVIRENQSLVGVSSGSLKVNVRYQQQILEPGTAAVLGGPSFPWKKRLDWRDRDSGKDPKRTTRTFADPGSPAAWGMTATLRWSSVEDELRITFPGTQKSEEGFVAIRPGSVRISAPGKLERMWPLSAAPLLPRRVELEVPHAGRPVIRIEGLEEPLTLPSRKFPGALEFSKSLKLDEFTARTGPQPRPHEASSR